MLAWFDWTLNVANTQGKAASDEQQIWVLSHNSSSFIHHQNNSCSGFSMWTKCNAFRNHHLPAPFATHDLWSKSIASDPNRRCHLQLLTECYVHSTIALDGEPAHTPDDMPVAVGTDYYPNVFRLSGSQRHVCHKTITLSNIPTALLLCSRKLTASSV